MKMSSNLKLISRGLKRGEQRRKWLASAPQCWRSHAPCQLRPSHWCRIPWGHQCCVDPRSPRHRARSSSSVRPPSIASRRARGGKRLPPAAWQACDARAQAVHDQSYPLVLRPAWCTVVPLGFGLSPCSHKQCVHRGQVGCTRSCAPRTTT